MKAYEKPTGYQLAVQIMMFALIVLMILVLVLLQRDASAKRNENRATSDLTYTKHMLLNVASLNEKLQDFNTSIGLQRTLLQSVLSNPVPKDTLITENLDYSSTHGVSSLPESFVIANDPMGQVLLKGQVQDHDGVMQNQLNALGVYFDYNESLVHKSPLAYSSVFYGAKDYLVYYPYQAIKLDSVTLFGVFERTKVVLDSIYTLEGQEQVDAISKGWFQNIEDEQRQLVMIQKTMPVVINNRIEGLLVGHLLPNEIEAALPYNHQNAHVYVLNERHQVVYTDQPDTGALIDAYRLFETRYEATYYANQFPVELEIRSLEGYQAYLAPLGVGGFQLLYVVPEDRLGVTVQYLLLGLLMLTGMSLLLIFVRRLGKRKHNQLTLAAEQAKFDSMTQLLNNSTIKNALSLYLNNKRLQQISVAMIDIDHFKKINDSYGHSVGDQVIQSTAQAIEAVMNNYSGVAGRYGGEEFMILLPRVDQEVAYEIADRIHLKITEVIKDQVDLEVTVSIGIHFEKMPTSKTASVLTDIADHNLYEAKNSGRNRVIKT